MMLKPFSLNPPAQKVNITQNKVMTVANLVEIRNFFKTEYVYSEVLSLITAIRKVHMS